MNESADAGYTRRRPEVAVDRTSPQGRGGRRSAVGQALSRPRVGLVGRRVELAPLDGRHVEPVRQLLEQAELADRWPVTHLELEPDRFEDTLWHLADHNYVVLRRGTQDVIGVVHGIDADRSNRTVGFGIAISPDLWRHGWPLEAALLFLGMLFDAWGYRIVYFHTPAQVYESMAGVLDRWLRLEVRYRSHVMLGGQPQNWYILSLTAEDWRARFGGVGLRSPAGSGSS